MLEYTLFGRQVIFQTASERFSISSMLVGAPVKRRKENLVVGMIIAEALKMFCTDIGALLEN